MSKPYKHDLSLELFLECQKRGLSDKLTSAISEISLGQISCLRKRYNISNVKYTNRYIANANILHEKYQAFKNFLSNNCVSFRGITREDRKALNLSLKDLKWCKANYEAERLFKQQEGELCIMNY